MEFLEKMTLVLDAIEESLAAEVDYRRLAVLAGCSEYHLSRMFPFLTGQSLSLYIRRRRLSQAALDLRVPGADLLTLAVRYGYSSVDAFRRAFKEVHGAAPSTVASGEMPARAFPRLTFQLHLQGVTEMVYRLVQKPSFRVVGTMQRVPLVFEGPNPAIDAMWKSLTMDQIVRWKGLSDLEPRGIVSASAGFSEDRMSGTGSLDQYIGVVTTQPAPEGDAALEVEAGPWAVFEAVGDFPRNLQNIWGRIYSEWFPTSGHEVRPGPEILWNEGPDTTKPDFRSEIWIPVVRK